MTNKKIVNYDYLRVFAIISIISIHVTDPLVNESYIWSKAGIFSGLIQSLVRSGVPLFFMLSGALLINRKNTSVGEFYKRRLIKVLIPLILISFFYRFLSIKGDTFNFKNIVLTIKDIIQGPIQYHLWFVYTLIGLYLITPFLQVLNEYKNGYYTKRLFLLLLLLQTINIYLPFLGIKFGLDIWYVNMWLIYYLLGAILHKKDFNIHIKYILSVCFISFIVTFYLRTIPLKLYVYGEGINMIILSGSIFILFKNLNLKYSKLIDLFSKHSYSIYLIHIYTLNLINEKLNLTYRSFNFFLSILLIIFLTFVISFILAYLIDNYIVANILKIIDKITK